MLATAVNECRALADVMVASAAAAHLHRPEEVASILQMKPNDPLR